MAQAVVSYVKNMRAQLRAVSSAAGVLLPRSGETRYILNQVSRQLHKTPRSSEPASKAGAPAPAAVPMNQLMDDFINGSTANYIEDLERRYVEDPESVPGSWDDFFRRLEGGSSPDALSQAYSQYASTSNVLVSTASALSVQKSIGVTLLIRAYQTQGHLLAKLDPLDLDVRPMQQDLDPSSGSF